MLCFMRENASHEDREDLEARCGNERRMQEVMDLGSHKSPNLLPPALHTWKTCDNVRWIIRVAESHIDLSPLA